MTEWKTYRAEDFCFAVTDGTHDSPKPQLDGRYLITSKHLKPGGIDFSSANKISEADYNKIIQRSKVEQYDILFSMIGTIGNIHRVTTPIVDFAVKNMGIFKMGGDADKSLWMYYWLKSPIAKEYIQSRITGSTQGYLTLGNLRDFPIVVPSLEEQRRIAGILGAIDDKIENNRRINTNLELQAQALFDNLILDTNLKYSPISEIEHIIETGRRPKGGVANITAGVPSIGAENIKGLGIYDYSKTKYITSEFAESLKKGVIKGCELLIYKDGGKPGYFIPNFSIFGEGFPYDDMTLNEHVFLLDFGNKGYNFFAYFYMQTEEVMKYLNAQGSKAAIPGINRNDVENISIPRIENEAVKEFCEKIEPIITSILINSKESSRLATLRDTLLPKLMNGEIKL